MTARYFAVAQNYAFFTICHRIDQCFHAFRTGAAPVKNYTEYLPDGANLALIVQKVGAPQPVIDYHSQQMALPASTIKLLTALAALLQLGKDIYQNS